MPRRPRIGYHPLRKTSASEIAKVSREVDQGGFSSIWLSDMVQFHSVFVQLAIVALNTDHVQIGPGCISPLLYHPVQTAACLASLSDLAPSRVAAAMCTGDLTVLQRMGINVTLERRLSAIRDAYWIWSALLAGKRICYRGAFFQVEDLQLQLPVPPRIPIYLAGSGEKLIELAGEIADGLMLDAPPVPALPAIRTFLDRGAHRGHRSLQDFQLLGTYALGLDHDPAKAYGQAKRFATLGISSAPKHYLDAIKIPLERVHAIRSMLPDFDAAQNHVTPEILHAFAVAGTVPEVTEQLAELGEAGLDEITLILPATDYQNVLRLLIREVLPSL